MVDTLQFFQREGQPLQSMSPELFDHLYTTCVQLQLFRFLLIYSHVAIVKSIDRGVVHKLQEPDSWVR